MRSSRSRHALNAQQRQRARWLYCSPPICQVHLPTHLRTQTATIQTTCWAFTGCAATHVHLSPSPALAGGGKGQGSVQRQQTQYATHSLRASEEGARRRECGESSTPPHLMRCQMRAGGP